MNNHKLRILVIDDEPLARRGIIARMARHKDVEIVAECGNGREAAAAIRALTPDAAFLDVQMPGLNGFDLVESVGVKNMPLIVLLTAHDDYALRAFEIAAVDYLLKPIDDVRFDEAVERLRQRIAARSSKVRADSELPEPTETQDLARLVVRERGGAVLLDFAEILWLQADGDYVRIHTQKQTHLMRTTLAKISEQLPGGQFVRIHRSALVNRQHVRQLIPLPNREYMVVLVNQATLRLSRTYSEAVDTLLPAR